MQQDNEERMNALAAIAEQLTDFSVAEQYQILAKEGLTLSDINWKIVYDPGQVGLQRSVTNIPVRKPIGK